MQSLEEIENEFKAQDEKVNFLSEKFSLALEASKVELTGIMRDALPIIGEAVEDEDDDIALLSRGILSSFIDLYTLGGKLAVKVSNLLYRTGERIDRLLTATRQYRGHTVDVPAITVTDATTLNLLSVNGQIPLTGDAILKQLESMSELLTRLTVDEQNYADEGINELTTGAKLTDSKEGIKTLILMAKAILNVSEKRMKDLKLSSLERHLTSAYPSDREVKGQHLFGNQTLVFSRPLKGKERIDNFVMQVTNQSLADKDSAAALGRDLALLGSNLRLGEVRLTESLSRPFRVSSADIVTIPLFECREILVLLKELRDMLAYFDKNKLLRKNQELTSKTIQSLTDYARSLEKNKDPLPKVVVGEYLRWLRHRAQENRVLHVTLTVHLTHVFLAILDLVEQSVANHGIEVD